MAMESSELHRPVLYTLLKAAYGDGHDPYQIGTLDEPGYLLHAVVIVRPGIAGLGFWANQVFLVDVYDTDDEQAKERHAKRLKALDRFANPDINVSLLGWQSARSDALNLMAESRPHFVTMVFPFLVAWDDYRQVLRRRDQGLLMAAAYEAQPVNAGAAPWTIVIESFAGLEYQERSIRARTLAVYRRHRIRVVPERILTAPVSLLLRPREI